MTLSWKGIVCGALFYAAGMYDIRYGSTSFNSYDTHSMFYTLGAVVVCLLVSFIDWKGSRK